LNYYAVFKTRLIQKIYPKRREYCTGKSRNTIYSISFQSILCINTTGTFIVLINTQYVDVSHIILASDNINTFDTGCPGSQEGKPHPGVRQTQYNQPVKRGDYPTVLNAAAASP